MTDREALVRYTDELGELVTQLNTLHKNMLLHLRVPGEPIPDPVPTPEPTPEPEPSPSDPCAGLTEPNFLNALAEGREMGYWEIMKRGFKGPTEQERACMASRGIPKPQKPSTPSVDKTGFVLDIKGLARRNSLKAGVTYPYTIPNTTKGERIQIGIGENGGSEDADTISEVRGPSGELLSGPATFSKHYGNHTFYSPGGTLTMYLKTTADTSLSVARN